jgi:hypothetical protein
VVRRKDCGSRDAWDENGILKNQESEEGATAIVIVDVVTGQVSTNHSEDPMKTS